jgi:hypothetical protein
MNVYTVVYSSYNCDNEWDTLSCILSAENPGIASERVKREKTTELHGKPEILWVFEGRPL